MAKISKQKIRGRGPVYSLQEFKDYADNHGGKCLSTIFISIHQPLYWECKEGHRWSACIRVRDEKPTWCLKCSHNHISGDYHRLDLEYCQDVANKYQGKCLSTEYKNMKEPLVWQCQYGHVFSRNLDHVQNQNMWCNKCIKSKKKINLKK